MSRSSASRSATDAGAAADPAHRPRRRSRRPSSGAARPGEATVTGSPTANGARGDRPGVAAVVAERSASSPGASAALRPQHQLHREAEGLVGCRPARRRAAGTRAAPSSVGPSYQGGARRALDDVVAHQRRDRHGVRHRQAQPGGDARDVGRDVREAVPVVVDEVDLVDRDDHVRHAQQGDHAPGAGGSARPRPCGRRPARSTASAVDAPVTVLRVYCTCPGQSARMKERSAVAK